jgi:hypothetical protein
MAIEYRQRPSERLEEKNAIAKCPMSLSMDDGRELLIQSWEPTIEVGHEVSVKVTGIIRRKKEAG